MRYGNARDLVLGLEVVLADGTIWNGLRRLRKDNTGYCLRQLFVGSEGTLGIITAAVLKLAPRPREIAVAFCAVPSPEAALDLFARVQAHDAAAISAFELMSGLGTAFVLKHIQGATLPLSEPAPFYVLVELATPRTDAGLRDALERLLEDALGDNVITDAAIAESEAQRAAIWRLREEHSEAQKREGASVKNDVSVPVSKVPPFIRQATEACLQLIPGIRAVPFGHMGDGNIHFNLEQPEGADPAWFLAQDHADHGHGERGGACVRRQLFRRTRDRQVEALHDAGLARRRRTVDDAADQGRARPAGNSESRQSSSLSRFAGEGRVRVLRAARTTLAPALSRFAEREQTARPLRLTPEPSERPR